MLSWPPSIVSCLVHDEIVENQNWGCWVEESVQELSGTNCSISNTVRCQKMSWRAAAFVRWDPTVRLASGSLEALTRQNCTKEAQGYSCNFCGRPRNDFSAMKLHMEACHFPSYEGHTCDICQKHCKTSHALACHKSRYHKVLWVVAECMLFSWAYFATKWKYIFSRAIITFWARPWPWECVWKRPAARRSKELSLPRLWKVLNLV